MPTMADAIALDVQPVGSTSFYVNDQVPFYLEGRLQDFVKVGNNEQPNLEKIFALKPDLIIGLEHIESIYDKLSQISPTVLGNWQGYPSWKDHFNFVAQVLGKEAEAKQVWAHYEQRINDLRTELGSNYQDIEVSFVRVCCNNWATDVKNSFSGIIFEDIGLNRPSAQDIETENGLLKLSEEALTQFDGDVIFLVVATDKNSVEATEKLKKNPLWQKLKAVQQGKVYPVNYEAWRGGNPLAADAVIDDLFKYLVEETAPDALSTSSR
ncbi:iron-siderophore ABC transporter substrate-binding protein [Acaryochloris sp. IP29b_bin.148]|uniref:iron-siderophore ABC transporter substrate-binding protein n=1 Tax=Acaryochloris sp. IP29b_bin.148 TaxID=2969218 RepID=UPI002630CC22|nr:iron-siderophore ABC transporter substrate-binding protein [Acaryochloris sp. IP29b_bin.148]